MCKAMEWDPYPTPYAKWGADLNVRPQTIKPLGENVGGSFMTLDLALFFWYDTKGTGKKKM